MMQVTYDTYISDQIRVLHELLQVFCFKMHLWIRFFVKIELFFFKRVNYWLIEFHIVLFFDEGLCAGVNLFHFRVILLIFVQNDSIFVNISLIYRKSFLLYFLLTGFLRPLPLAQHVEVPIPPQATRDLVLYNFRTHHTGCLRPFLSTKRNFVIFNYL